MTESFPHFPAEDFQIPENRLASLLLMAVGICIVFTVILAIWILIWLASASYAHAHDMDHPERTPWMAALQNASGVLCCDFSDANATKDVTWDIFRDPAGVAHFKVFMEGGWVVVPDSAVVNQPNKYGIPMIWTYHSDGVLQIRCFLPGGGM